MNYHMGLMTAMVFAAATAANAQLITSDPYLAGHGRSYQQVGPAAHFQTPTSFFDVFITLDMQGPPIGPPPPGASELHSVPVTALLDIDGNGTTDALTDGLMLLRYTSIGSPTSWDMEIYLMNLSGGTLPPGMMLRENQVFSSVSNVLRTDVGGGQFRIDSFFDIFTELTIDGGQTWIPASNGASHMNLLPAPGSATLLAFSGLMLTRRRRL